MSGQRATPEPNAFPLAARASTEAGLGRLVHLVSTRSTNADLVTAVRTGTIGPSVLVADHQTDGRGRLDRSWEADPGEHLLVSFCLSASGGEPADLVSAVAASARACVDEAVDFSVRLKWPNDLVVVDGPCPGKVAGVLAEYVDAEWPAVIVGIGINVGSVEVEGATSIAACGGVGDRDALLAALIRGIGRRLVARVDLRDEMKEFSATLGARVRVELPDGEVLLGMAVDIDQQGRLQVDDGRSVRSLSVGDVVHLRPQR